MWICGKQSFGLRHWVRDITSHKALANPDPIQNLVSCREKLKNIVETDPLYGVICQFCMKNKPMKEVELTDFILSKMCSIFIAKYTNLNSNKYLT